MSNSYNTRVNFIIAHNDELNTKLYGMWYRHQAIQYVVMPAEGVSEWFDDLTNALNRFEELTNPTVQTGNMGLVHAYTFEGIGYVITIRGDQYTNVRNLDGDTFTGLLHELPKALRAQLLADGVIKVTLRAA